MWKLKILIQFILAVFPGGERVNFLLQHLAGSHAPKAWSMTLALQAVGSVALRGA